MKRNGKTAAGAALTTLSLSAALIGVGLPAHAWQGMVAGNNPTPKLHVTGRFLQDPNGKNVNLHGYMQPGASWFNGEGANYPNPDDFTNPANFTPSLNYLKGVVDIMSDPAPRYGKEHGWYNSYVRYIGDGSGPENFAPGWDAEGNLAKPEQFNGWINNVVVPYIQHCKSKGLYVILVGNPSEAFPLGNDGKPDHGRNMTQQYQKNLIQFWTALASNPAIKSADNVHFEICNEPIAIETQFGAGDWAFGNDARWAAITKFMQPVVDAIRAQGADNIIWIPGLGWQGEYAGFAKYPVLGGNIGYAAHLYPAYGASHNNATKVRSLWGNNYKPAADRSPMIITEMMWNPNPGQGYEGLWNASSVGFGNAFRIVAKQQGNVSFQIGMIGDLLGNLKGGLKNTTLGTAQGTQAAFDWYPSYKDDAPTAPVGPAEGVYQLSPSEDSNMAIEIGANTDGTRFGLSRWSNAASQKFRLHALGNNRYWIEPQNAVGKCLDIANFNQNDDAAVQLWSYSGTLNQQWIVMGIGNGEYRLASGLNPNQTLDLAGGTIYAGQAGATGTNLPAPPDPNLLAPPDPTGGQGVKPTAAFNLQTYTWWGAPGQKWKLIAR